MTQSAAFTRRIDRLCGGRSPYDGFLAGRYTDEQRWNSHHAYLADTLWRVRPSVALQRLFGEQLIGKQLTERLGYKNHYRAQKVILRY